MFYLQWPSGPENGVFPGRALQSIEASGALPIVTWEPMFLDSEGHECMIAADSIIGGKYDGYLQCFARESRRFGKPSKLEDHRYKEDTDQRAHPNSFG